jgi:hypothetical protein
VDRQCQLVYIDGKKDVCASNRRENVLNPLMSPIVTHEHYGGRRCVLKTNSYLCLDCGLRSAQLKGAELRKSEKLVCCQVIDDHSSGGTNQLRVQIDTRPLNVM